MTLRSPLLTLAILAVLLGAWQLATQGSVSGPALDPDYAKLVGEAASSGRSPVPTPVEVGRNLVAQLSHPFYDNGPNDKGLGIQLAYSLGRVLLGYGLAVLVAVPLGFAVGMSPLLGRALDPFVQIHKTESALDSMPLAL